MTATLEKIRWQQDLARRGQERKESVSPELSEALRNELRTALEADGKPFDINVARRVYDLAIAARDMCVAATGNVKEAIDQIKDTNGPMENLGDPDAPESAMQASETFGARLIRELLAILPSMRSGSSGDDPQKLVHALAEARRNGMHDVAEQIEVKLFGRVLLEARPVSAEDVDVVEGSFEHGNGSSTIPRDVHIAIARDIRLGRSSEQIRDEIIAEVGMMADARTPEMQARYDAALLREGKIDSPIGPTTKKCTCPAFDNSRDGLMHDQACPRFAYADLAETEIAGLHPDTRSRYEQNAREKADRLAKAAEELRQEQRSMGAP